MGNTSLRLLDQLQQGVEHLRRADPILAAVIEAVGEPALAWRDDGFTALVYSIISQQISVKAAAAIRERLVLRCLELGGLTPAAILSLGEAELRAVGLSRSKAGYLLDLAAKVMSGEVELSRFAELDDETIIDELTRVKGIGRWTAEMFLIFNLSRPDVLPVDDLGFRAAVRRLYGIDHLPTAAELRSRAEPWRPFRSLATWYLWRSGAAQPAVG